MLEVFLDDLGDDPLLGDGSDGASSFPEQGGERNSEECGGEGLERQARKGLFEGFVGFGGFGKSGDIEVFRFKFCDGCLEGLLDAGVFFGGRGFLECYERFCTTERGQPLNGFAACVDVFVFDQRENDVNDRLTEACEFIKGSAPRGLTFVLRALDQDVDHLGRTVFDEPVERGSLVKTGDITAHAFGAVESALLDQGLDRSKQFGKVIRDGVQEGSTVPSIKGGDAEGGVLEGFGGVLPLFEERKPIFVM